MFIYALFSRPIVLIAFVLKWRHLAGISQHVLLGTIDSDLFSIQRENAETNREFNGQQGRKRGVSSTLTTKLAVLFLRSLAEWSIVTYTLRWVNTNGKRVHSDHRILSEYSVIATHKGRNSFHRDVVSFDAPQTFIWYILRRR